MRLICQECKKVYDYDVDDFCPRCGAYNQPPKAAATATLRKDGINERDHHGSFVHREVHSEKEERRRTGLDAPKKSRPVTPVAPSPRGTVSTLRGPVAAPGSSRQNTKKNSGTSVWTIVIWIIILVVLRFLFL